MVGVTADSGPQETVWVGLAAAERALPPAARPRAVLLLARMTNVDDADSVRARLSRWADARFGAGTASVRSNEGRLAQVTQGILLFKLFMGAITGVSLLVGGIGIMNVLLASVTERTREIGIRKAMGATRRDVLWQFLAESVAVASLGSGIGVALGLTGAYSITALMRSRMPGMQVFASVSASTLVVAVAERLFVVGWCSAPTPRGAPRDSTRSTPSGTSSAGHEPAGATCGAACWSSQAYAASRNRHACASRKRFPLFPLGMVLYPGTSAPLHLFEPRYRQMLRDVQAGDRRFGIVCAMPGVDERALPPGRVGCVAEVTEAETLEDGRSNIFVTGRERFVLDRFVDDEAPYHVAEVTFIEDEPGSAARWRSPCAATRWSRTSGAS